ncbi:MarR family transcriptional regulator [Altericroceibacterium spongiae]|uniref:MarR family transcriptional regulator n=1 Tax=Altericroceibacterium spongiae TaxID=2320269 RepID=A0A420EPB2_9SPHN|nr:MarR family transcriptional regulator [Altericroceibacterium spongiae]RKF22518.1 MarR family transcriptional regulator [Altericroceibacterium spongiae]
MTNLSEDSAVLRLPRLADEEVDFGLLAEMTGFSVKLVWILGYTYLTRAIDDAGITPQRFSMLELIGVNPGLTQTQLARALGLSRPATSLTIDFWEGRGHVERRIAAQDRRSFGIHLTAQGKTALEGLRVRVREADDALTRKLGPEEIDQLRGLLARIYE